MNGWFAMNRAMFSHPIFKGRPERVAAWAWMLATAAWRDTNQDAGGKQVAVKRGQLLTSYRQMSEATGVPIQPLRTLINQLSASHAINTDTNTGRLLITIRNYDKYQTPPQDTNTGSNGQSTRDQHTKEQDNNKTIPPSEEAEASKPVPVSVVTAALWSAGKQYLSANDVKNPGGVIGKWLKTSSALEILNALEAAQRAGTENPVPYITEVLKGELDVSTGHSQQIANRPQHRVDPALEQIARLTGLAQA